MTVTEPQGQGTGTGQQTEPYSPSEFAAGILAQIPEEHRSIVEQYLPQWDAGVTRRFQDIHSQYRPYQELGDVESVSAAVQFAQLLEENPQEVYNYLVNELGLGDTGKPGQQVEPQSDIQGLPQDFLDKFGTYEKTLNMVAEWILGQNETQQERQEDAELDQYMGLLKREYGDFDEDFVLAKMYAGMDGGAAVAAWQSVVQQQINAAFQNQGGMPPILSGQGGSSSPVAVQNIGSLPRNDVKKLVADMLANAAAQDH